ncbi:MAG: hypothetical protein PHV59_08360 [Victivallales bacterium]|nr:hypothetical protein [Victivallales bacterium]
MSGNRKKFTRYYTIVEVMVAMGIFLIMMTIMMQFFSSAQTVWNTSAQRNILYADARVAMNLMTREIQSIMYYNDGLDTTGSIYPFWFEWTEVNSDGHDRSDLTDYLKEELFTKPTAGTPYLTALNFIANTDLKPCDKGSDICEIRYKFVPVYYSSPQKTSDIHGGQLRRSCTAEYDADGNVTSDTLYNFESNPYDISNPDRIVDIWNDTVPSSDSFHTVIDGVYSLTFTCYHWSTSSSNFIPLAAMEKDNGYDADGNTIDGSHPLSSIFYDRITGTPCPLAVRIDMKLMPPEDLKRLALNIYISQHGSTSRIKAEANKQIPILKQKIRTFSKVIFLGKRED